MHVHLYGRYVSLTCSSIGRAESILDLSAGASVPCKYSGARTSIEALTGVNCNAYRSTVRRLQKGDGCVTVGLCRSETLRSRDAADVPRDPLYPAFDLGLAAALVTSGSCGVHECSLHGRPDRFLTQVPPDSLIPVMMPELKEHSVHEVEAMSSGALTLTDPGRRQRVLSRSRQRFVM